MKKHSMYRRILLAALVRGGARVPAAALAVSLCAALLSALIAISFDMPAQMGRELRSYGANLVLDASGDTPLNEADLGQALRSIPTDQLIGATPFLYARGTSNEQPLTLAGTRFDEVRKVTPYWQVVGKWPDGAGVLLGAEVAELLGLKPGSSLPLRDAATGREATASVDGVLTTGGPEEGMVFADIGTVQELSDQPGRISLALVSVLAQGQELNTLVRSLQAEMPQVSPRLVKNVSRPEDLVLGKLQTLISVAAAVILVLTLITVATTMTAMVVRRRKEIGLKKALGAGTAGIMGEFLGEAATLGVLAGLAGMGIGFALARIVSRSVFGRVGAFPLSVALIAVGITLAACLVACIGPARAAANVQPAVVLRNE